MIVSFPALSVEHLFEQFCVEFGKVGELDHFAVFVRFEAVFFCHPNHRRQPVRVFACKNLMLLEYGKTPGRFVTDILERAPAPGRQADQIPFFENEIPFSALFGVIV